MITTLAMALQLLCVSEMGVTIHVDAEAIDTETYQVRLRNGYMDEMHVDQQTIKFSPTGDMIKIQTSYLWESLTIERGPEGWGGVYWYDLGYYPLHCTQK